MGSPKSRRISRPGLLAHVPAATGIALCLVIASEFAALYARDPTFTPEGIMAVGLVTSAPFLGGLLYGGRWLRRSELSSARYARVGGWTLGGLGVFLALNVALIAYYPTESAWVVVGWLRWAGCIGGAIGLFVGVIEARAIERAVAAERANAVAASLEQEREWLEYLNSLLRHEVLNAVQIISGNATYLRERHATANESVDRLETIERQSRNITNVVGDVRTLIDAADGVREFEPVDLGEVLAAELQSLRDTHEGTETEADVPDEAFVLADDLLPRVFANLFDNAVEHNDSATPRVRVDVERREERVRVRVADNGSGFPEREQVTVFERDDDRRDHGLGLYLVQRLVERYGGEIELTETGPDGSVVTVSLPRAEESDEVAVSQVWRAETEPV